MATQLDVENGLAPHKDDAALDPAPEVLPLTCSPQRASRRLSFIHIHIPTWRASAPIIPTRKQEIHPQSRNRHWRSIFWVSKVDHPTADFVNLPNGFVCGSMSDSDFCQWVLSSSRFVQDAVVCNMTWWRATKAPFFHQFIVLTIAYRTNATAPFELYDLKLERIGKARSFRRSAEHRVTISKAQPLSHFAANHNLMFGLLAAEDRADWGTLIPPKLFKTQPAFRDQIDDKWRGPPATLAHVAQYVENIVHLAPRYNLSSTNCYYFSRLLMHIIALRHYSFQLTASNYPHDLEPRSKVHDPSSISSVFHFLRNEERVTGVLVHLLTLYLINLSTIVILFGAYWGGLAILSRFHVDTSWIPAWAIGFPILSVVFCYHILNIWKKLLVESSRANLALQAMQLVQTLDDNPTLTHPRGKRGDYVPVTGYKIEKLVNGNQISRRTFEPIKITTWVDRDGARVPVKPWEYPEQCYTAQPIQPENHDSESPLVGVTV